MQGIIQPLNIIGAIFYSIIGVAIFWISFMVIDRVTPYHLWKEIIEEKNVALAIIVGAIAVGISVIVASAIH